MKNIIIIDSNLEPSALDFLGGKGRGLYILKKFGVLIPESICIPPDADPKLAVEDVLKYFNDLDEQRYYAVRSSASIEDGITKSFAGQFESMLRVKGKSNLEVAVNELRNLINPDNERLKKYTGDSLDNISMTVIVQEMIEAESAGVIFTCDPVSGSGNHILLERTLGTAEDLLSGTLTGERFIFIRDHMDFEPGTATPPDKEILTEVFKKALELEEKIKDDYAWGSLDLEWAIKDGQIFWLQVRPVTSAGRSFNSDEQIFFIKHTDFPPIEPGETHWTSVNAREAVPWVLTPLVERLLVDFVENGFKEFGSILGLVDKNNYSYNCCGLFNGRIYLNITDLGKMISKLPLKNPEILAKNLLMSGSDDKPQIKLSIPFIIPLLKIIYSDLTISWTYKRYVKKEYRTHKYPDENKLRNMSSKEISDIVEQLLDLSEGFPIHIIGSMKFTNYYSFVNSICRKYGLSSSPLLMGLGTLFFASSAEYLRDLAYALKDNKDLLIDENNNLRENWKDTLLDEPTLEQFKLEFDKYMDKFGHLGDGSINIYEKCYREEPEKVLKLVADVFKQGPVVNREEYLAQLTKKRNESIKKTREKLPFIEKIKFDALLYVAQISAHFRENVKFLFCRRSAILRCYVLEIARRLVEKGIIDDRDDIFFLKHHEIKNLLEEVGPTDFKELIKNRKTEFNRLLSIPCPLHRVDSSSGARLYFPDILKPGGKYKGTGASAGRVMGKAKVILSLKEADRLQQGEILVTSSTEPSWTPLFSIANAVVVEIGSLLSHGSVVAREIGIPAVIGIPGIVGAIKDGDMLLVDGTEGTVEVITATS
jgi:pyruvate,water dikinase